MSRTENRIYPVEKIIKKRLKKNKFEYLVKWKHYDETHNSWEPESNFLDKAALDIFNASQSSPKESPQAFDVGKSKKIRSVGRPSGQRDFTAKRVIRRRRLMSSTDSADDLPSDGASSASTTTTSTTAVVVKRRPIVRGSFRTVSRLSDVIGDKKSADDADESPASPSGDANVAADLAVNGVVRSDVDKANGFENLGIESEFSTATDDRDQRSPLDNSKNKNEQNADLNRPIEKPAPVLAPPTLQVMVSDSELWLINERNTKQKNDENVCQSLANQLKEEKSSSANGGGGGAADGDGGVAADADKQIKLKRRLDIVLTDVKAHDYSVVFKECYASSGFFHSPS